MEKGAGEVLSFCLAHTSAVAKLLTRARGMLLRPDRVEDANLLVDLNNVALLIVGSARHPLLQFLGDIISSALDADKLDYLFRDAATAGLPLRYDLERYLYTVSLEKDYMTDAGGGLSRLYRAIGTKVQARSPIPRKIRDPHFDCYRLKLPKRAMSTIEQIIICKIMLFSYIYHHQKVRAAEGLLERLLTKQLGNWRQSGFSEEKILRRFMTLEDWSLHGDEFLNSGNKDISDVSYRIINRLLPREVYALSPALSHEQGSLIQEYFLLLKERKKREKMIAGLQTIIGEEILKIEPSFASTPNEALWKAGIWIDVPKAPEIEEIEISGLDYPPLTVKSVFPVDKWTDAYRAHRYFIRRFAYSEFVGIAAKAGRKAFERTVGITSDDFYEACRRKRI